MDSVGSAVMALIVVFSLGARLMIQGVEGHEYPSVLAEIVAALGAGLAANGPRLFGLEWSAPARTLLALVVYLSLWEQLSRAPKWLQRSSDYLEWRRLRESVRLLRLASCAAAVGVTGLLPGQPLYLIPLIPLFLMVHKGAENACFRVLAQEANEAIDRLSSSEKSKRRLVAAADQARQQVSKAARRAQMLEGFVDHLAAGPDLETTMDAIVVTAGQLCLSRSVVLMLVQQGRLRVVRSRTPSILAEGFTSLTAVLECRRQ